MATTRKACKDQYASISNAEAPCKLGEERGRTGLTPLLHDLPYQIVVVAVWRTKECWGFVNNTFVCLFYSPHFVMDLIITNDNMRRLSGGIKEEKDKDGSVLWSNESCLKRTCLLHQRRPERGCRLRNMLPKAPNGDEERDSSTGADLLLAGGCTARKRAPNAQTYLELSSRFIVPLDTHSLFSNL